MSKGDPVPSVPKGAPQPGEVYRHYKGGEYKIVDLALHSNDDEWMVVYQPLYEIPGVHLFVRPLNDWVERIDWEGQKRQRFEKL